MLKGIENIPRKEWSKLKNELPDRWSLSNLKKYNKWYKGERKNYEIELRQFHTGFLAELTKTKGKNLPEIKEQLTGFSFNPSTGDFSYFKTKGTIALGTNEFKIFSLLYSRIGNFVDHLTLSREMNTDIIEVRKSHKDSLSQVIRNIKRKFGILPKTKISNPDIFNSTPKAGYRLINKDK
jgi:DNA-binding winged helix-turn-helix (wHTH) protein